MQEMKEWRRITTRPNDLGEDTYWQEGYIFTGYQDGDQIVEPHGENGYHSRFHSLENVEELQPAPFGRMQNGRPKTRYEKLLEDDLKQSDYRRGLLIISVGLNIILAGFLYWRW